VLRVGGDGVLERLDRLVGLALLLVRDALLVERVGVLGERGMRVREPKTSGEASDEQESG